MQAKQVSTSESLMTVAMLLAASLYDWLLFLHILAAMVWVGGLVALGVLATQVLRSGKRDDVVGFVSSLRVIGPLTLAPASIAVLGFGIWMVIDNEGWDFGQTWIVLALAFFAAAFLVGAVFQSRAAIGAQRAADAGDHREASRKLRRWSWGMLLIVVLLVVATWDMVFKPGL
jgi:uncharacterized membrane protein